MAGLSLNDLREARYFLSRIAPVGAVEQNRLADLIEHIDKVLNAKEKGNGTGRQTGGNT
jgi:hypothetical protein